MADLFTWAQLSAIVGLFGLALTAWKIRSSDLERINGRIDDHNKELMAFQLHVATLHPTGKELAEIEKRLTEELRRLTERIDRILERAGNH